MATRKDPAWKYCIEVSEGMNGKSYKDCPEECREAVASLMYAAARFSDLPELRELRDILQRRYESCLEAYVNKKFAEKLSSRPPDSEKRLQVLQDIASEFSLKWDSRGFEQRIASPSVVEQVDVQKVDMVKQSTWILEEKRSRIRHCGEDNVLRRKGAGQCSFGRKETIEYRNQSVSRREGSSLPGDGGDISSRGMHTVTESKQSYFIEKGDSELKVERSNMSSHGEILNNRSVPAAYKRPIISIRNPRSGGESREALFREKAEFASTCLEQPGRTEEGISLNYPNQENDALPPPYVKSKDNTPRPPYIKPKEEHKRSRSCTHAHIGRDHGDCEHHLVAPVKVKNYDHEKEPETIPLPKPQSSRREHHKLFDDKCQEERMIDNLLIHYSKRPASYDAGKLWNNKSGHRINNSDVGESSLNQSRDAGDPEMLFPHPTRPVSLPHKQQPISTQPKKVYARANTFQPDGNQARHVHTKLPDYDDLAARFAALKGR